MLSNRFYSLLSLFFCPMAKIGILKYDWNSNTNLFVPIANSKRRKNYFITLISLTCLLAWLLFLIIQIFRFYYIGNIDSLIFSVTCLISISILFLCCLLCTLLGDELVPTINSYLIFLRMINGKNVNIFLIKNI